MVKVDQNHPFYHYVANMLNAWPTNKSAKRELEAVYCFLTLRAAF